MVTAVARPQKAADIRGGTVEEINKRWHVFNKIVLVSGVAQKASKVCCLSDRYMYPRLVVRAKQNMYPNMNMLTNCLKCTLFASNW